MKILVVCQLYYPENFVITNICEELVKIGHDVTVLTGKPNYGYNKILPEYVKIKYEEINGVKVHRVKLVARNKSRFSIIKNYLSFWKNSKSWIRKCEEKFDIVYSMSLSPVTILAAGDLYKKKHNVPHVVHCVDLWPESVLITHAVKEKSLMYKILYKWSYKLYKETNRVIIGSPSFKEYFNNVLKMDDKGFDYIPQPCLVDSCSEQTIDLGDGFNILYCGNIGRIQLIPMIAEAMKDLKNTNIRFHIIGMGPESDLLQSKINEYGLENTVIYHGPIPAKRAAQYFKSSDALYVSLKNEGYVGKTIPNKLVMSMAFGKPILAMLGGDGKDILNESKGSIIVDQDVQSLKEGIFKISSLSKEEKEKLGNNNRAYYESHFTLNKISKEIEKVLFSELN